MLALAGWVEISSFVYKNAFLFGVEKVTIRGPAKLSDAALMSMLMYRGYSSLGRFLSPKKGTYVT